MTDSVLSVKNLSKSFGSFIAVDDVSFDLKEGEILGLLGPNGAGKTTTIQMLLGVLTPTRGEVFYFGKKFSEHRSEILEQVNFSSTYTNLPWDLSVKECLTFISYLYNIPNRKKRVGEIIEIFKLDEILYQTIQSLSAGQVTRVNVAKAFLNNPKVLLLDEPTASLDPDVADYIRKFLLEERRKFNVSVIFTSHNMAEVEEVCDRVLFVNHGKIIANDTPRNLTRSIETCHIELLVADTSTLFKLCSQENLPCKEQGKYIVIDVKEKNIAEFLRLLSTSGIVYDEISIEKPTLEDYFLQNSKPL